VAHSGARLGYYGEAVSVQYVVFGSKVSGRCTLPSRISNVQCIFAAGRESGEVGRSMRPVINPVGVQCSGRQRLCDSAGVKECSPVCGEDP